MRPLITPGRVMRVAVLVAALGAVLTIPNSAYASQDVVPASSMIWPAGSGSPYGPAAPQQDPQSPSAAGYHVSANADGVASVTTTDALTGIRVYLRSDQSGVLCQGSPQVEVQVDGTVRLNAAITPSGPYQYQTVDVGPQFATFSVAPGTHAIAVGLTNNEDSAVTPCQRSLWIQNVTLIASRLFSPSSYVDTPLPNDTSMDDPDQSYLTRLTAQVSAMQTWSDPDQWNVSLYVVPAAQATAKVTWDSRYQTWDQWGAKYVGANVPLPSDATSAAPTDGTDDRDLTSNQPSCSSAGCTWSDRELVLYQPATDTGWEFYHLVWHLDNWLATGGGRLSSISTNAGHFDSNPNGSFSGVSATQIPYLATTQTISELRAGTINHVVSFLLPDTNSSFRSPALASDGRSTDANSLPEGIRFRLPATFNIDGLNASPYVKMLARAVQRYGMVLTDTAGAVKFYYEEPRPYPGIGQLGPYGPIFFPSGVPSTCMYWQRCVLNGFPWSSLVVVKPTS